MTEYLSKVLLASLRELNDKGILNASVPAGHLVTLSRRGFIIEGQVGEYRGWIISEKGKRILEG
jgi:hypothetical protein